MAEQDISEITTLTCGARLHFGLLDLSGATRRVDGGVGLAVKSPSFKVRVTAAPQFLVSAPFGFKAIVVSALKVIKALLPPKEAVRIELSTDAVRHCGFGSTTQCSLLVAKGLLDHFGIKDIAISDLAAMLGRGGTSGIGIYAFSSGGLIVDGGRSWPMEKQRFGPSFSFSMRNIPPLVARLPFPDWGIVVVVPSSVKRIFGKEEISRFMAATPIPLNEVERACRLVMLGVLPTVATADFEGFTEALEELRGLGLKRIEWERLGHVGRDCAERLRHHGVRGISVSSWGPAIFGFVDNYDKAAHVAMQLKNTYALQVYSTEGRNIGALR